MVKVTDRQRKAASNLAAGMNRVDALKAAGYSESTARTGSYVITKSPGFRMALYDQCKQVADMPILNAIDQEKFVRVKLFEGALGESGLIRLGYLTKLGTDKRVAMFAPDVVVGVQVNVDAAPDPREYTQVLPEVND